MSFYSLYLLRNSLTYWAVKSVVLYADLNWRLAWGGGPLVKYVS